MRESRVEDILTATINDTEVTDPSIPQSRVEALLMDLKDTVDEKLDSNYGSQNEGKVLGITGTGAVEPMTVGSGGGIVTAGDVTYSDAATYSSGTIGAELTVQKSDYSALVAEVNSKAPAIVMTSDTKHTFSDEELAEYDEYTMICDATDYNNIAVAKGYDVFPETDSATSDGLFTKLEGNSVVINGTPSEESYFYTRVNGDSKYTPQVSMESGDVLRLAIYVDGTITGSSASYNRVEAYVFYTDNSNEKVNINITTTGIITASLTCQKNVAYVAVYVRACQGYSFDDVLVSWCGAVNAAFQTVAGGDVISFSSQEIGNDGFTMLPGTAYAKYVVDTKTYIDNSVPPDTLTKNDLVYLSPEMYGAKGNGEADDTSAVQSCINAAITDHKVVRGYGRYKTTSTVVINGADLDIFLHTIDYRGHETAITIAGKRIQFSFDTIHAERTSGICLGLIDPSPSSTTERIMISGISLYGDLHAITLHAEEYMAYIIARVKQIYAYTSDAIKATGNMVKEVAVYDARFDCNYGWCYNGDQIKMFNCTMEVGCYGGVYAKEATMCNCRAVEMMDCLMVEHPDYGVKTGILFKAKSDANLRRVIIDIDDDVYYDAIDLSEFEVLDDGSDQTSDYVNYPVGYVRSNICYGDTNYYNGHYYLGHIMLLHGNDRICVPPYPSVWTIDTADFDLRDSTYASTFVPTRPPFATRYVVGVDNCIVRLSPSYCAEGYSKVVFDMTQHLATIYDRRGNVIFDPTNKDNGVYELSAEVDQSIDTTYQYYCVADDIKYPINSGYCDVWTTKKLS